jgi:hypothetical protein
MIDAHKIYFVTKRMQETLKKIQSVFEQQRQEQNKQDDEFYDRLLDNNEVLYVFDAKNQTYIGRFSGNS